MSNDLPPNRCATCGSEDIASPEVTHDGADAIRVDRRCKVCGTTWVDHYQFVKTTDYTPGT